MSFWRKFFLSLIPSQHYVALAHEPSNESFRYFLKVAILFGLINWGLTVGPQVRVLRKNFSFLAKNLAPIEIRDGLATAYVKPPFMQDIWVYNVPARVIIDTTLVVKDEKRASVVVRQGSPKETQNATVFLKKLSEDFPVSFLVTKNRLLYQSGGRMHHLDWDVLVTDTKKPLRIDAKFWKEQERIWIPRWCIIWLLLRPLSYIIIKFIECVIYSGYAMFLDAVWKSNLEFFRMLSVCFFAMTPTIILGMVLAMLAVAFPWRYLIYYGFYALWVTLGLRQLVRAKAQAA